MNRKQCRRCGGWYHESFFHVTGNALRRDGTRYRRSICIGCEQTARDERKRANRPRVKAEWAYNRHARRFLKLGIIKDRRELREVYGWDIDQMTQDIDHAVANGCPYCGTMFFSGMWHHGWADITLDIVDPEQPPHYRSNVRWVCVACNSQRQQTPPERWALHLQYWERRPGRYPTG